MKAQSQSPKEREYAINVLNAAIEAADLAEDLVYRSTSQDRLWLRPYPSHANQGMFPVLPPRSALGSKPEIIRFIRR